MVSSSEHPEKHGFSESELDSFLSVCEQAARAGGETLLQWMGKTNVREKGPGDLVTQADFASQETIRELISSHFKDHRFLGEENDGGLTELDTEGFCWIVDPLDGTINFIHQLRSFSVSVGLAYRGQVIAGCVFDPLLEESYRAALTRGATLNGEPIQTSACTGVEKSLLVCSFSSRVAADDPEVTRFLQVMQNAGSVRRLGSAALNLCYVACGRMDGYWATSLKIWDVAAGLIILRESGGVIEHIDGSCFRIVDPRFVAAANSTLLENLRPLMRTTDQTDSP